MPVKDVYGKEVSEQNHMILAHSPTSMLIEELRKRKMSDREIMDSKPWKSINNPDLWRYTSNLKKMPNQKWHQIVSFIKSGTRILGYGLLIINLPIAVTVLIFSEVIGIIEELV